MAGDVQAPSGTGFDPSPQFWVDRLEPVSAPVAVIGRCFFGPVGTGLVFDGVVPQQDAGWPSSGLVACCLRVAEVYVVGRLTSEVDQVMSARLVLSGDWPACLAAGSVLVARGQPGDGCRFRDGL